MEHRAGVGVHASHPSASSQFRSIYLEVLERTWLGVTMGSCFSRSRGSLRICISKKPPGDADAARLETTLRYYELRSSRLSE